MREARRVRASRRRGHAGGDLARSGSALRGRRTRLRVHTAPVALQVPISIIIINVKLNREQAFPGGIVMG